MAEDKNKNTGHQSGQSGGGQAATGGPNNKKQSMQHTMSDVIRRTTEDYIASVSPNNIPEPAVMEAELLDKLRGEFDAENAVLPKGTKWKILQELEPTQIAMLMCQFNHVIRIDPGNVKVQPNLFALGMYVDDPNDELHNGIYVEEQNDSQRFFDTAKQYDFNMASKKYKEVLWNLRNMAPIRKPVMQPNLMAVIDGIADNKAKVTHPFSPDMVFLFKLPRHYRPGMTCPAPVKRPGKPDWQFDSWFDDLFTNDDGECHSDFAWKIISAVVRPFKNYEKVFCLYGTEGNNGKGTFVQLIRNTIGEDNCSTVTILDSQKDFLLYPLTNSIANLVDEESVGSNIKEGGNYKAIATKDVINLNVKFQQPVSFRYFGTCVSCWNSLPRFSDKTGSMSRRFLIVPMTKKFDDITKDPEIKNELIADPDTLDYVFSRAFDMDFDKIENPDFSKELVSEFEENNDSVLSFLNYILPELTIDLVPWELLYAMYVSFMHKYLPSGKAVNLGPFRESVKVKLAGNDEWTYTRNAVSVGKNLIQVEPLIGTLEIKGWTSSRYKNSMDDNKLYMISYSHSSARGIVRTAIGKAEHNKRVAADKALMKAAGLDDDM